MNGKIAETSSDKKQNVLVYIFNMSEDVWPFISSMSDAKARSSEIVENAYLGDTRMFQFAGEDDEIVYITPHNVSDSFLQYFQSLFGSKKITVLTTGQHSGVISEDIKNDASIMNTLADIAHVSNKLTLVSYAATKEFLTLVTALRDRGLTIFTPESPDEEDAWTVNFYGSKSGIRQLSGASAIEEPDFRMVDGLICFGIEDASYIAARRYVKEQGVVIKTNKGHSGMGVLIYREGDLPSDYHECQKKIYSILSKDKYWRHFPIVIEKLINVSITVAGGNPNVEFKIGKNGRIDFLYQCGMLVTPDGVFHGIEVGHDIMPERVAAQIKDTGYYIAERFSQAGYRGYFDVDCVAGKNGEIYVAESNMRTTGGTFVYSVATKLFGENFMYETYLFSNNGYLLQNFTRPTFSSLLDRLKPVLFDKETREGVVVTSENLLRMQKLSFIMFGKTKKRAYDLYARMEELLKH